MYFFLKTISVAAIMVSLAGCTDNHSHGDDDGHHDDHETHASEHSHDSHDDDSHAEHNPASTATVSETRSAARHTHGDASMAIVLDGRQLIIELDTPLYNVLGFEHAAETAAQKATVLRAETILSKSGDLFTFNSEAACAAQNQISVDLGLDEHEDDHGHEGDHDDHSDETHKDISLRYEYICAKPKALEHVTLHLFDKFETLSDIELVYLGPNIQKQDVLSLKTKRMSLKR